MNIKISNYLISPNSPTFIIAEGGINHNGKIRLAKELIRLAKECNADAIKFQTFTADDLASINSKFYRLFKKLELSEEEFSELSDYAKSEQIIFLSTPFSKKSVDVLNRLHIPAFKIASGDLTYLPLIKYVAKKKKPILLSTGMATINEINDAIDTIESTGNKKILILHSSSSYPTPSNELNLKSIRTLSINYKYPIGFSDNGDSLLSPIIAVSLGAKIIEKHFTINKQLSGPDHKLSCNPKELRMIINQIRKVEESLGDGIKKPQSSELKNRILVRRSLNARFNLKKNSVLTLNDISITRPATGISPQFLEQLIGKTLLKSMKKGESFKLKYIENMTKTNIEKI